MRVRQEAAAHFKPLAAAANRGAHGAKKRFLLACVHPVRLPAFDASHSTGLRASAFPATSSALPQLHLSLTNHPHTHSLSYPSTLWYCSMSFLSFMQHFRSRRYGGWLEEGCVHGCVGQDAVAAARAGDVAAAVGMPVLYRAIVQVPGFPPRSCGP